MLPSLITGNNGIHIFLPGCNCDFGFEELLAVDGFGEKKARIGEFFVVFFSL